MNKTATTKNELSGHESESGKYDIVFLLATSKALNFLYFMILLRLQIKGMPGASQ